jgi:hypothetical protein
LQSSRTGNSELRRVPGAGDPPDVTRGKIKACLATAAGDIDESLIFHVEKKTRLVNLPRKDQARLLRDKFPLRRLDGGIEDKHWTQMTGLEKLQLVGPRCDQILPPDEQEVRTKGDRRLAYDQADLVGDDLVLRVGKRSGKINLATLVLELYKSVQSGRFLKRYKQLENALAKTHD